MLGDLAKVIIDKKQTSSAETGGFKLVVKAKNEAIVKVKPGKLKDLAV